MVELTAAPVSAWAVSDSALRLALRRRQQRDLDFSGRPIAGDGEFLVPVVGDPDRRLRRARQLDRRDRLHADASLRAEAAADMIGDHAHLVVTELVAFGDQLLQLEYRLRRDMQGQALAVEAGDGGMRLEAGMRLRTGAECRLDQQRIARLARVIEQASRLLCLLREDRGRPADDCLSRAPAPRRPPRRCRLSCGSIVRTRPAHRFCARRPIRSPTARRSLVIRMAAIAASAVLRSFAATAAIGSPT